MAYLEFEIPVRSWSAGEREILMARLLMAGFESFAESRDLLQAYIPEQDFDEKLFIELVEEMETRGQRVQYRFHRSEEQNWNEEWEKKFEPVIIREKVLIRAPFHTSENDLPCTLIVEPKMSFGTGHHHTTQLMIGALMDMDLRNKRVLDMGCGTGILGIYACHRGASRVLGVDNDQWAYENALENAERNNTDALEIRLGDVSCLEGEIFEVILANITRNTLVKDMPEYLGHLAEGGILLLSGILEEDMLYVVNEAYRLDLEHRSTNQAEGWLSLTFEKKNRKTGT